MSNRPEITPELLANLGEGHVAYVRPVDATEVPSLFPDAPEIEPGHQLWALLSANGTPIMLADDPRAIYANAHEHDLATVRVH